MLTATAETQAAIMTIENFAGSGSSDSWNGLREIPPRTLELLVALNHVFDAHSCEDVDP